MINGMEIDDCKSFDGGEMKEAGVALDFLFLSRWNRIGEQTEKNIRKKLKVSFL